MSVNDPDELKRFGNATRVPDELKRFGIATRVPSQDMREYMSIVWKLLHRSNARPFRGRAPGTVRLLGFACHENGDSFQVLLEVVAAGEPFPAEIYPRFEFADLGIDCESPLDTDEGTGADSAGISGKTEDKL